MTKRDTASQPPHILVLWDIDHTLIETRGVGQAIYERVFPAVTGKPLRQLAEVAGRTELVIMHDTLQLHDVQPTEQMMRRLAAALIQGHEDARQELATAGRALPGAKETLAALAADPRVHQAVLSGNLRDVSRIKLEIFGLDQYLDLASSAYGDDHTERPELVTIAQQRATERVATRFDNQHTVLIGDTPKDVEAAITAGVRVIGVASGKSDENELMEAGAQFTIPDLTHTATVVRLVTDGLQASSEKPEA
ncbi:MAG: haloacid dehalogenase-like hydrolase [Actinobacteria bacterium]|nr:haloacid dehalogenase-like hydrolase [Actinomycetota bacterium]